MTTSAVWGSDFNGGATVVTCSSRESRESSAEMEFAELSMAFSFFVDEAEMADALDTLDFWPKERVACLTALLPVRRRLGGIVANQSRYKLINMEDHSNLENISVCPGNCDSVAYISCFVSIVEYVR
jgi:hypothetical protein